MELFYNRHHLWLNILTPETSKTRAKKNSKVWSMAVRMLKNTLFFR
jgi:hypothetical protein